MPINPIYCTKFPPFLQAYVKEDATPNPSLFRVHSYGC